MCKLLMLKHLRNISDESVVEQWSVFIISTFVVRSLLFYNILVIRQNLFASENA